MTLSILGLATSVPIHTMTQDEATDIGTQICCQTERQERLLKVLYRRSGVKKRHTVLPHRIALSWLGDDDNGSVKTTTTVGPTTAERMQFYAEHAGPLALEAAEKALQESPLDAADVTHLVTVSSTGFQAPGVEFRLIDELSMKPTVQRVNVGFMGCHGAVNGLRVAQGLALDPEARVLLCAVELCSLHYHFGWDPEKFVANTLFADGAGALVCQQGDRGFWNLRGTGSCVLPNSSDAMSWTIGDFGFEMTLSPRVPDIILEHLRSWLSEWLGTHGVRIEDVRSWAIHPGGPRIVATVEEALGLGHNDTATSRAVLSEHGNMSSPTILFILDRLRGADAPGPCVALAFGPGLVAEVALFDRG